MDGGFKGVYSEFLVICQSLFRMIVGCINNILHHRTGQNNNIQSYKISRRIKFAIFSMKPVESKINLHDAYN